MRLEPNAIDREKITREELLDRIFDDAAGFYEERETEWGPELARSVERFITLQVLDTRWREHLDNVDYLRQGIGLRGYAQKDPLVEYKLEAEMMFGEMDMLVKQEVVRFLMHAEVQVEESPQLDQPQRQESFDYLHADAATLEALAAGAGDGRLRRRARAERLPGRRAAPARPRADGRPQRSVLVRLRQEVQAVPWRIASRARSRGRVDDLRAAVEELRAQLHWVRDYL